MNGTFQHLSAVWHSPGKFYSEASFLLVPCSCQCRPTTRGWGQTCPVVTCVVGPVLAPLLSSLPQPRGNSLKLLTLDLSVIDSSALKLDEWILPLQKGLERRLQPEVSWLSPSFYLSLEAHTHTNTRMHTRTHTHTFFDSQDIYAPFCHDVWSLKKNARIYYSHSSL